MAVAVQVLGSLAPSRHHLALILVPLTTRRVHQSDPAAPEDESVPCASVIVSAPPALSTRDEGPVHPPAASWVIRATYPLRGSAWARAPTRTW